MAAALPYAVVPKRQLQRSVAVKARLVCFITQNSADELEQPVFLLGACGTSSQAFEHEALLA